MIVERIQIDVDKNLVQVAETGDARVETEKSPETISLREAVVIAEQLAVAQRIDRLDVIKPTDLESALLTLDALKVVNWAISNPGKVEDALDYWSAKPIVDQIFPYPSRSNRASQNATDPARVRNLVNPEDAGNIRRQEKMGFVRQVQGRGAMVAAHNARMQALKREVVAFYANPPAWIDEITKEARRIVEKENIAPDTPKELSLKQKAGSLVFSLSLLFSRIEHAVKGDETPIQKVQEQTQAVVYEAPKNPIVEARNYWEERLRQEGQNLFSIERINIDQTDAEKLIRGNLPIENAKVIQEINIEGDLVFESKYLQEKVDYAKGWVRDLRAQGHKVSLKTIYDYEEGKLPTEVGIVISIDSDFTWGTVDVKRGGYALIDTENNLHFINPSSDIPNTKIEIIKLDQDTIGALKETYLRLGYGNLNTPEPGSWIAVEIDEDGDILQIITEIYTDFLVRQRFSGSSNVNVRSQPTTRSEVIQRGVDAETEVLTPTAVPPEERLAGEREEDGLLFVSAEGYNWTRVITKSGAPGFVAYEVLNVGIVKEAAGPRVKNVNIFKTLEEINYIDAVENPHEAYGITEEEYLDTYNAAINTIPEEIRSKVLNFTDGFNYGLRAFVWKNPETGQIFRWRPGLGSNVEDGFVTKIGDFQFSDELKSFTIEIEGRMDGLGSRSSTGLGLANIKNPRLSPEEMEDLESEFVENWSHSIQRNTRLKDGSTLYIQILDELKPGVKIYKLMELTSNLGDVLMACDLDEHYDQGYGLGRMYYGLKETYDSQKEGIKETVLSEMLMILTYQFLTGKTANPKNVIWSGPVKYRFSSQFEGYVSNVLGVPDLAMHAYAVRPRSLFDLD